MSKLIRLFLFLSLLQTSLFAQNDKPKVFIEFNNESEGWINQFLAESNNWDIVGNFDESNVVFRVQMSENAYRAFGKIFIIDSQTNETLFTTNDLKGQSSAFNGYAPKKNLAKKLIDEVEEKFKRDKINLNHFGKNKTQPQLQSSESGDKYDKLLKIKKLLDDGIITKEEYEKEKKKILDQKDN